MNKATPKKKNSSSEIEHPIHELIGFRQGIYAFDNYLVESEKLLSILEAARWSPSPNNIQSWRFMISQANLNPKAHTAILKCMDGADRSWASTAPVLMVALARLHFDPDVPNFYNAHAWYDVGQAVMNMTHQASVLGLNLAQVYNIQRTELIKYFNIPSGFQPVVTLALGYPGDPASITDSNLRKKMAAQDERDRLPEFAFGVQWKKPVSFEEES